MAPIGGMSTRTTLSGTVGPPAVMATLWPDAESQGENAWYGRSKSVSCPVCGSSTPSREGPLPWLTARRPSPSTANGYVPSCHSGAANSSSRGHSACGVPAGPARYRFHHPDRSETAYRLRSSRHTGASTDSRSPPMTTWYRGSPSAATRSSVPSHGIRG